MCDRCPNESPGYATPEEIARVPLLASFRALQVSTAPNPQEYHPTETPHPVAFAAESRDLAGLQPALDLLPVAQPWLAVAAGRLTGARAVCILLPVLKNVWSAR